MTENQQDKSNTAGGSRKAVKKPADLSDQELNRRLALVAGWKVHMKPGAMGDLPYYEDPDGERHSFPPNYAGDLNAVHEVERELRASSVDHLIRYKHHLACVVEVATQEGRHWTCAPEFSTARQRAEALLEVLG